MPRPYLALGLGALAAACSLEAPATTDVAESAVRPGDAPLVFAPCPLSPGATAPGTVTCANVDVPLDWSKPEGRRINFFVKRIQGSAPGPHKQLWLLQGGPGGAGDGLDYAAAMFLSADPALDLYIPDHRGTGRSSYLGCPNTPAGPPAACIDELLQTWTREGLANFSTTAAARDVGHVVARTRTPGQQVHIYGVSYGTYLAQRYLQIFPQQPTSVTLDGLCQAGLCSLVKYSYWSDRTAQAFMRDCATDAVCNEKLGSDPLARVKDAIAVAKAGTCTGLAGMPGPAFQNILHMFTRMFGMRTIVPALAYRVLRCDERDVVALQNFVQMMMAPPAPPSGTPVAPPPNLSSSLLASNIAFSEMMEVPITTREELQTLMATSVFATYSPATHNQFDLWPRYEHDEYVGGYPDTDVPVLLLNGTLDSATPIEFANEIAPHYTRPHQTFVSLPRATHGTFQGSPTTDNKSCAFEIFKQFIAAPTSTLDTSCRDRIVPHDFAGNPTIAQRIFGSDDIWENPTAISPKPATSNTRDAALEDELRRASAETY